MADICHLVDIMRQCSQFMAFLAHQILALYMRARTRIYDHQGRNPDQLAVDQQDHVGYQSQSLDCQSDSGLNDRPSKQHNNQDLLIGQL